MQSLHRACSQKDEFTATLKLCSYTWNYEQRIAISIGKVVKNVTFNSNNDPHTLSLYFIDLSTAFGIVWMVINFENLKNFFQSTYFIKYFYSVPNVKFSNYTAVQYDANSLFFLVSSCNKLLCFRFHPYLNRLFPFHRWI